MNEDMIINGFNEEKQGSVENSSVHSEHSEEIFKKMYLALYDYYLSRIGFLDLLQKFEEILGIKSPQTG
jgi:hypothetical protein